MADMAMWPLAPDEDGSYEAVSGQELFMLSPTTGDKRVYAQEEMHDDVTWFLDYSILKNGEDLESHRYLTKDDLSDEEAKAWALEVVEND